MRLLITGTPGTGKTKLAKLLAKKYSLLYINEKEFALSKNIASYDAEQDELLIDPKELEAELNKILNSSNNVVVEGHILCETKLNVDLIILLRIDPELLSIRLEMRGYSAEKIQDNVFCEGIDYCKKHVERRYTKSKIIELDASKKPSFLIREIDKILRERGLIEK